MVASLPNPPDGDRTPRRGRPEKLFTFQATASANAFAVVGGNTVADYFHLIPHGPVAGVVTAVGVVVVYVAQCVHRVP
jgi:hypothetical protein